MFNYLSYARTEILSLAEDNVPDRQVAQLLHSINTAYADLHGAAEHEQPQEQLQGAGTSSASAFLNDQQPLFTASNNMFNSVKEIRSQSQNPTTVFLLAAAQGWAANAAVGGVCAEMGRGSTAVLTVLAVHPDWQRSGIALKLLQDVEAACVEKGATTMSLEVSSKELHHYFAKQGYTNVPSEASNAVDLSMLGAVMQLEKRIGTKKCIAARKRVLQHRALKAAVYKQVSSTFPDLMPLDDGGAAAPFGGDLAAAAAAVAAGEYKQAVGRTPSEEYAIVEMASGGGGVAASTAHTGAENTTGGNGGTGRAGGGGGAGAGGGDALLRAQAAPVPAAVRMPEPPTQPYDSEYLNGCLMSVWMHDPAVTGISFCTMLITATALLDGMESAMMETVLGTREKYADGQELQGMLEMSEGLINDYKDMLGGLWRKFVSMTITVRKVSNAERRIVQDALKLLEAQFYRGIRTQNSLKLDDWPKIIKLLSAGKGTTVPFILLSVGVGVIDRSLAAVYWNQKAEIMSYLIDMVASRTSAGDLAKKRKGLLSIIMSLFVIRTAQGGVSSLEALLTENGVKKFNYDLIVAVVNKLYSIDLSTFETKFKTPGAAMNLAFNKTSHVNSALALATGIATSVSGLVATITILYRKNPKLLFMMLSTNVALNIFEKILTHTQDLAARAVQQGAVQADVQSQFSAIESREYFTMSRCCCQEETNVQQIRMAFDSGIRIMHKSLAVDSIFGQVINILRDSGTFLAYWLGGLQVLNGTLSAGDLTSFMVQSEGLIQTAEGLLQSYMEINHGYMPGIRELARFMDMKPKIGLTSTPGGPQYHTPSAEEVEDFKWSIDFNDCTFAYPRTNSKQILNGFSAKIESGTLVGICGETHCGKSTVLRLVERLYDVNSGEILINGEPITALDPTWLRRRIGFVMSVKDTEVLRNKSILQQIEVGAAMKGLTSEDIRARSQRAAKIARIEHEIEDEKVFPKKWHTTVGDQGDINLSDGQTQRLSIARGLVGEPNILLMDEYTSALDGPTEEKVRQGIEEYVREPGTNRTAVIVAHRMCTITSCDQILYMKEGKVFSCGSHAHLMQECAEYEAFYRTMVKKEEQHAVQRQASQEVYEAEQQGMDDVDVDRHTAEMVTSAWHAVSNSAGMLPVSTEATPLTRSKLVEMRDGINRLINAREPAVGLTSGSVPPSPAVAGGFHTDISAANAARRWMDLTPGLRGSQPRRSVSLAAEQPVADIHALLATSMSPSPIRTPGSSLNLPTTPLSNSPRRPRRSVSTSTNDSHIQAFA